MLALGCPTPTRASVGRPQARCLQRSASVTSKSTKVKGGIAQRRVWQLKAEESSTEPSTEPSTGTTPKIKPVAALAGEMELENVLDAEQQRKKLEADKLRDQEKFMVIGAGDATCSQCSYEYKSERGDPDFPAAKGTAFQDLPDDYTCPLCGSNKSKFRSSAQEIPGFAVNQGYGFGTNAMTSGQKQGLIYGALIVFFFLFLSGYFLD
ncbi:hypothetical protein BSKO_12899 [Bryopsis sp. KO-2023]|nr:hypothetical protein BSKO_12899 [Bryopsis sp. KO-2023]